MAWQRGVFLALAGASGSGKTTIIRELLAREPRLRVFANCTTRGKRESDIDGEYVYLSRDELDDLNMRGMLLMIMDLYGVQHSTLRASLLEAAMLACRGASYLATCNVQRVLEFRMELVRAGLEEVLCPVFLATPSVGTVRRRLRLRGELPEGVKRRLVECANWEKSAQQSGIFRFVANPDTEGGDVSFATEQVWRIIVEHRSLR